MWAAQQNHFELVKFFFNESYIEPNAQDKAKNGSTALHMAASEGMKFSPNVYNATYFFISF